MGRLTLVLGGARSGKSAYAQSLAALETDVVYVATAAAGDDEMARRIAVHRAARPPAWRTVECQRDVAACLLALEPRPAVAIVDCLSVLVSNLVSTVSVGSAPTMPAATQTAAEERVAAEVDPLMSLSCVWEGQLIVVSSEVGSGLVPDTPLSRLYRDLLGHASQRLATAAAEVVLLVAGIPVRIKG